MLWDATFGAKDALTGWGRAGQRRAHPCNARRLEAVVTLRFLGIHSGSPDDGSPTIWLDDETADLVIQSYKADAATLEGCRVVGSIPGHSSDVPDHETVIRLPASMLQFIPRLHRTVRVGDAGS